LLNLCSIQEQRPFGKEALKKGFNILTNILNKQPEQPIADIFKTRFSEAKENLEQQIKMVTGLAWF
jgi:hypothetical protein